MLACQPVAQDRHGLQPESPCSTRASVGSVSSDLLVTLQTDESEVLACGPSPPQSFPEQTMRYLYVFVARKQACFEEAEAATVPATNSP